MIAGFVASPYLVLFVIAAMAAETLVLIARRPGDLVPIALALLPGACMLGALWWSGARGWGVAAFLTTSLPIHLLDLHRRGWIGRGGESIRNSP